MTSKNKLWEDIKAQYLEQVRKALSSGKHPRSKEILEDIRCHLDRRFAELEPSQQTWEDFQKIILEMGPASDYSELLESGVTSPRKDVSRNWLLWLSLVAVAVIVALLLPTAITGKLWKGKIADKTSYSFVNDPQAPGRWTSVDFITQIEDFQPGIKRWGGDLYLGEITFSENGHTSGPWTWTNGLIIHQGDKTASKYLIKEINGSKYMFLEWKTKDYTAGGAQPGYYILKKEQADTK